MAHCWTIQANENTGKNNRVIQFYGAPMKSLNELIPPKSGWMAIDGIDPVPMISDPIDSKEMQNSKLSYQNIKNQV